MSDVRVLEIVRLKRTKQLSASEVIELHEKSNQALVDSYPDLLNVRLLQIDDNNSIVLLEWRARESAEYALEHSDDITPYQDWATVNEVTSFEMLDIVHSWTRPDQA